MTEKKNINVKSASRVLDVLEYIVNSPKAPTFRMIRDALDIPKSSLSYLLQDLITRNYINSDLESKVYYPGLKLLQLGAASINNTDISREIALATKKLSDDLKATAHAAILDGRFVVYIAKAQSTTDLSLVTNIGYRIPAHATAVGKVLLSGLTPEDLETRFKDRTLERYTENTIVSFSTLKENLLTITKNGYAIDNQEVIPGGICVASPIYDKGSRIIASISATFPLTRLNDVFRDEAIQAVCAMARYVSIRLGNV